MSKPREFWIRFKIGDNESTHQITDVTMNPIGMSSDVIHVIEYSAYEKLQAALDVAVEQLNFDVATLENHDLEPSDIIQALSKIEELLK